jgi:zona occludens toxin (predicted ATPase)
MILIVIVVIVFAVCWYAAWHRARTFNRRDASGDYRTTPQRLADWNARQSK